MCLLKSCLAAFSASALIVSSGRVSFAFLRVSSASLAAAIFAWVSFAFSCSIVFNSLSFSVTIARALFLRTDQAAL
jgi:hypothetical protein